MPIPIGPLQRLTLSAEGVCVRALRVRQSMRFDACDGAIVQPGGEVILLGNRGDWLIVRPNLCLRRGGVTAEVLRRLSELDVVLPDPEARRVVEAADGHVELRTPEALAFARYLPPSEPILAFAELVGANGRRVLVVTDRRTLVADMRPNGLPDISSVHHVDVRGTHLRGLAHDALVLELEQRELALTFRRAADIAAIRTLIATHAENARDLGDEPVDDDQNERPIRSLRYQDILRGPAALAAVTVGLGAGTLGDLARVPHGGLLGAVVMVALLAGVGVARRSAGRDWRSAAFAYSTTAPILALVLAGTALERALG